MSDSLRTSLAHSFIPFRCETVVMFCVRFDAKFVLLAIVLASCIYCSEARLKTIPFLMKLLDNHPTLIRMRMLKIQGQQPNPMCSIDISSTAELTENHIFRSSGIRFFAQLKLKLRGMSCQFFSFRESNPAIDGTIFTHDVLRGLKSEECNLSALKNVHGGAKVNLRLPDIQITPNDVSALFDLNNEPSSQWWTEEPSSSTALKTIPFLVNLLQNHPTLIRMRMLKIRGQQPNPMCSIDVSSTAELNIFFRSSSLSYFSKLKLRLRSMNCQFFVFPESNGVELDGTIFTHDALRELKPDDCNPSALYNIRSAGPERFLPDISITPADVDVPEPFDFNNEPFSQWSMEEGPSRKQLRMSEDKVYHISD